MTRARLFTILEDGAVAGRNGAILHVGLAGISLVSLLLLLASAASEPMIPAWLINASEALTLLIFTLEYAARLWVAPENPHLRGLSALAARLRHGLEISTLLDLALILLIIARFSALLSVETATALSLVRCLKLVRYSTMLSALTHALVLGRKALLASAVIVAMIGMLFGAVVYLLERQGQPDEFGNLPATIWWAVGIITGGGSDESSPDSLIGQVLYVILSVSGFLVLALPMGVIGASFDATLAKRNFVVTWNMVSRVPLFRDLSAAAIASISEELNAESFSDGNVIIRRGEIGDRMYLILTGTVEVAAATGPVRLQAGDYFGEHALLTNEPRSATVTARGRVRLLSLSRRDMQRIMDQAPEIAVVLQATDRARSQNI